MKKSYIKFHLFISMLFILVNPISAQMDMMNAIPSDKITHKAVINGSWFSASTWSTNSVPGTGAIVYIPKDITVNYQGSSNEHIFAIRVDGNFNCTQNNSNETTKLVFDTFFACEGRL